MTPPDLLYSDVEDDLRAGVRDLLQDHCAPAAVLARCETEAPYDLALCRKLAADMGLAGLAVPESLGGQGASVREAAVVLEELGRSVAPVPFLDSAVLATSALLACETAEPPVTQLLGQLAAGSAVAALAVPLSTAPVSAFPTSVRATEDGVLTGRVSSVVDAQVADVVVVPAVGPDGPGLYAADTAAAGLTVSPLVSLDLTRRIADVVFEDVPARLLAGPGIAKAALDRALTIGAGLLASEQLGIAQ